MTEPLLIDEVHAERFGGLSNTRLALGGKGLVVVHGPNESGKTTFATLLAWLLVGPTGTRDDALRFGKPNDQLAGHLVGSLAGQSLRIDGTFKLLQRGLPNANGVAVHLADKTFDLDAWRMAIGGIDPKVLTATYRMWGADLHSDEDVLAELTQAALTGMGTTVRLSEVDAKLQKRLQEHLTGRGENAESFSALGVRRNALEADIKEISANAADYRRFEDEMVEVGERLRSSRVLASELSEQVSAISALLSVAKERQREKLITDELKALPTVPELWVPLVDDLDRIPATAAAVDKAMDAARTADQHVRAAAGQAGLTDAEVEPLRVTHATVTAVQVSLTRLETARSTAGTADDAWRHARASAATAEAAAERALAACPEVSSEALRARPITATDVATARTGITDWAAAERQVVTARTAVSNQQATVDTAAGLRDQARVRWERFGTGVPAQQWRATPTTVVPEVPAPMAQAPNRSWVALAAAGVVALVAVLALPRWAAVVVTAVAFAGGIMSLRRTRAVTSPATAPVPVQVDPAVDAERLEAANAVIAAEAGVDQAERELLRLRTELERLERSVEHPRSVVHAECQRLSLPTCATPTASTDLLDRVLVATSALSAVGIAHDAVAAAQRSLDAATSDVDAVLNALCSTLVDAGVPQRLPCEATAAGIDALRQVTDLVGEYRAAERAADEARQAFETLMAPLGEAAAERSPASLVAEAERLLELHTQRSELERERDQLNHTINTRFREHPAAKAMASQGRSDGEWAAELEELKDRLSATETERDDLNRTLGELRQAKEQLMDSDVLTDKRLQLGMIAERADEQLLAGVVAVAARSLLARTAAERRRTHQPALLSRAGSLLSSVATDWQQLLVDPSESGAAEVTVVDAAGGELAASRLSTGARALTHLALRLATAELDADRRRVRFPIICDDPLVHLDDDRAKAVMPLLARAATDGHQVIVFTCHGRTVDAARAADARVVDLV